MSSDKTAFPEPVTFARGKSASDVVRVGVIGYGYWGPNIVRNFHGLDKSFNGRGKLVAL